MDTTSGTGETSLFRKSESKQQKISTKCLPKIGRNFQIASVKIRKSYFQRFSTQLTEKHATTSFKLEKVVACSFYFVLFSFLSFSIFYFIYIFYNYFSQQSIVITGTYISFGVRPQCVAFLSFFSFPMYVSIFKIASPIAIAI